MYGRTEKKQPNEMITAEEIVSNLYGEGIENWKDADWGEMYPVVDGKGIIKSVIVAPSMAHAIYAHDGSRADYDIINHPRFGEIALDTCQECGTLFRDHAPCMSADCEGRAEDIGSDGLAYCRACMDYYEDCGFPGGED